MLDPYCPLVGPAQLPDNANLVAPKGGLAGSMPINSPSLTLSSLAFLLDDFSFQVNSTQAVYSSEQLQHTNQDHCQQSAQHKLHCDVGSPTCLPHTVTLA